jgi:hypothetical protein
MWLEDKMRQAENLLLFFQAEPGLDQAPLTGVGVMM